MGSAMRPVDLLAPQTHILVELVASLIVPGREVTAKEFRSRLAGYVSNEMNLAISVAAHNPHRIPDYVNN